MQCAQCAAAEPLEHDFEKTRTTIQRRWNCRASLFLQDSDGECGQDGCISLCGVGAARGDAQAGALVRVHGRPVRWSNELRARFVVLTRSVLRDYDRHSQSMGRPALRKGCGGEQCDHVSRSPGFLCVCACAGTCAGARRPSLKRPGWVAGACAGRRRPSWTVTMRASSSAALTRRAGIAQEFVVIEWLFMF